MLRPKENDYDTYQHTVAQFLIPLTGSARQSNDCLMYVTPSMSPSLVGEGQRSVQGSHQRLPNIMMFSINFDKWDVFTNEDTSNRHD